MTFFSSRPARVFAGSLVLWVALFAGAVQGAPSSVDGAALPLPLAVVGDSDSHGYHDSVAFPPGSPERGGAHRDTTYQWTEVLWALRGDALDLGPRTHSGTAGRLARWLDRAGVSVRAPHKLDHLHNFAVSGQGCDDLWGGASRQVPELLALMRSQGPAWQHGLVVIRIGVNTFGKSSDLDRLAKDPADPQVRSKMDHCLAHVQRAVMEIQRAQSGVRIVLVGIFDNQHWAAYANRWPSAQEQSSISKGLDHFDKALRRMVDSDPRLAFFDDRAWFAAHWGGRAANGQAAYHPVKIGGLEVTHSMGDGPTHAVLADGHAGTVWNALWAQALVTLLNERFQLGIRPIEASEIGKLPLRRFLP